MKNSKSPFLSQLVCTRHLSQHTAPHLGIILVKPKKPELRSFSNNFYHATDCETKLMPKRRTPNERKKKTTQSPNLFASKSFKIFETRSSFCGSYFFWICVCLQLWLKNIPQCYPCSGVLSFHDDFFLSSDPLHTTPYFSISNWVRKKNKKSTYPLFSCCVL